MYSKKILIFIPMYNCINQIARVIAQFNSDIGEYISEILIVDNRSEDASLYNAQKALRDLHNIRPNIRKTLIQNKENYSLGGSHKIAFNYAISKDFDYLIVLHGDDQGSISDLLLYLQSGECYKYDSFLGSRFMKGSKLVGYSKFRTLANYLFNFVCSIIVRRWITDQGSGLNMYKVSYLNDAKIKYMSFADDLTFPNMMFFYGIYAKSLFKFFPISWRENDQISNAKIFKQALNVLQILLRHKQFYKKVKSTQKTYEYDIIVSL